MASMVRSCLQSMLKLVNSLIGMVGMGMILYAVWLIRQWQQRMGTLPFADTHHPVPWFIYAFLGLGATLCVVTCAGHIAAETVNGCCLYLYMGLIIFLIMVEGGVVADIFLNGDWKEDFPEDPSGAFNQFSKFIESNFKICRWIGLSIVCVQGVSVLLAMLLKALGPHRHYDSDDEYNVSTVALLRDARQPPPYVVGEPIFGAKPEAWTDRINERANRNKVLGPGVAYKRSKGGTGYYEPDGLLVYSVYAPHDLQRKLEKDLHLKNSSKWTSKAGHSLGEHTIFTSSALSKQKQV